MPDGKKLVVVVTLADVSSIKRATGGSLTRGLLMKIYKILTSLISVPSIVLLSGCGGGGGGGGNAGSSPSFASYDAQFVSLAERNQNIPFSDPASLPTTGSATYSGVLAVQSGLLVAAGDLTLNANFGPVSNPITGSVTNIVNNENQRYSGSLAIGNSSIDRTADVNTDYTFAASLTGQLGLNGETGVVNGEILGDFLGTDQRSVAGEVFGTISNLSAADQFEGGFIAER